MWLSLWPLGPNRNKLGGETRVHANTHLCELQRTGKRTTSVKWKFSVAQLRNRTSFSLQDQFMVEEVKHYLDSRGKCLCVPRPEPSDGVGGRGKRLIEKNMKTREEGHECVQMVKKKQELVAKLCPTFPG